MIRKTSVGDVDVYIEGKGNDTIVMIHGWPDTFRLWDDLAAELAKKHVCIRFTVPGFDIRKARRACSSTEMASRSIRSPTVRPASKALASPSRLSSAERRRLN